MTEIESFERAQWRKFVNVFLQALSGLHNLKVRNAVTAETLPHRHIYQKMELFVRYT